MRNKTKVRLTILTAAFLLFFGLLLLREPLTQLMSPKSTKPLSSIKPEDVTALTIQSASTTNNLQKKNNHWILIKDNFEYKADSNRVEQAIEMLVNMEKGEVVSSNKSKHADLGIGPKKIVLKAGDTTQTIYLGNPGSTLSYVRINDEDEVFTTKNLDFMYQPEDYRNLNLGLITDETKVTAANIIYDGMEVNLMKDKESWTVNGTAAKKEQVDFFLTDLKSLQAIDATIDAAIRDSLAAPSITLSVKEGDTERQATFYYKDETEMYGTSSISSLVYIIPTTTIEGLKVGQDFFTGTGQ